MIRTRIVALVLTVAFWTGAAGPLGAASTGETRWPRFRGPNGAGLAEGTIPVHFGPHSNVLWRVSLPTGHSSPCLWGSRIFLTAFTNQQLQTLCLDRGSGRLIWQRSVAPGPIERGAHHSHPATATPVTDGQRVYVYFGSFGLVCYDVDGTERWQKPLPIPVTQHGAGTSPVLAGSRLLLNCDQDVDSSLLAVDAATGRTLWQVARPGFRRGFATPLPWPPETPDQVIVPGTLRLVSYQLDDGAERWSVRGLPNELVSSAVGGDGLIYVAGWTYGSGVSRMPEFDRLLEAGDANRDGQLTRAEAPTGPAKQHFVYIDANKDGQVTREEYQAIARIFDGSKNVALAVRPDGRGDVTETHVAWRAFRGLPYVPSPLLHDGRLYLIKNGGLVSCLNARTGEYLYQEERLGALGDYYASPVAAGERICVASQAGVIVVFLAGAPLRVLARNALEEPILATPAIADGTLYVRTQQHLYAFREAP